MTTNHDPDEYGFVTYGNLYIRAEEDELVICGYGVGTRAEQNGLPWELRHLADSIERSQSENGPERADTATRLAQVEVSS